MLSEQIRAIGQLAHVIVRAALRSATAYDDDDGEPAPDIAAVDLAAVATFALDGAEALFLPAPSETEAVQLAIRLAEQMLAILSEADAARASAAGEDEALENHYSDDTGLPYPPRGRRRRSRRGRLWRVSEALCVPGEEGDMVRIREAEFQHGATFVGLTGHAGRTSGDGECYIAPAAARAIADALLKRADAIDPHANSPVPRRRNRRRTTRGDAAREAQGVRTNAA